MVSLANLGVGAIEPGQVTIRLELVAQFAQSTPITDPKIRTLLRAERNQWVIRGSSNNGGVVLRWFRDEFSCPEVEQAQQLNIDPTKSCSQLQQVPAGSEGLLCLPFLSGERAPYWNANARGLFFGIGLHHKRTSSALSLKVFCSAYIASILRYAIWQEKLGRFVLLVALPFQAMQQMMTDVFACDVLIPEVYEASSFGAAAIAMRTWCHRQSG